MVLLINYYIHMSLHLTGFAESFSVNPNSLKVHRTTPRFAFECQIETFARTESDFNRMRIEWVGTFSSVPGVFHIQNRGNTYNPLPGYSILVVDTNSFFIDRFPDTYWCRAIFISQNGSEVTVATSEPGLLMIDGEGMYVLIYLFAYPYLFA